MQQPKHTHASSCPSCTATALTRNHYFTGKLMVERDFTDEQRYFLERLRLHNQRLHGEGVACGLRVRQHDNPACQDRYVILEPGSAIDCCGHDILVVDDDTIDLSAFPAVQALRDKPDDKDHVLQVAICYRECPTEEIPVLYDECGCDDSQCAPNRILESYAIDVKVDPPPVAKDLELPSLDWVGTVGLASAAAVAIDEAGARLFVLQGGHSSAIYQFSSSTHAVETSISLGRQAFALALSPDGATLYAVVAGTSPMDDTELWLFDVSGPATLAVGAKDSASIAGSGAAGPVLVMTAKGELLAGYQNGQLYRWTAPINAHSPANIPLGGTITSIVASVNGKRAWVGSLGSADLQVLDLTVVIVVPTKLTVRGTDLFKLALASSTGADLLVAVDKSNVKLHLIDPAQPSDTKPLASIALAAAPVDVVVSPGGAWAYVDETTDSVQVVDLHRLKLGLPTAPTPPFAVGPGTAGIAITATGARLYVPYVGAATDGSDGGVAVIDIEDTDCGRPLHEVRRCPDCGRADCVVLATVRGYRPGRKLLDPADPAPTPAVDATNSIARIDNLDGRTILASTQTLQEVVECLLDHGDAGGLPGPQGPPGTPGTNGTNGAPGLLGPAGPGLDTGIPRIVALSWRHSTDKNQLLPIDRTATMHRQGRGVVIAFSTQIHLVGDSGMGTARDHANRRNIFSVETPDLNNPGFLCRCPIDGEVIPVDFKTIKLDDPLIISASEIPKFPARAMAFIIPDEVLERLKGQSPEFWVCLRGEFVIDDKLNAVDAAFVRARLPSGDRRISPAATPAADPNQLLSLQGTQFESWFLTVNG